MIKEAVNKHLTEDTFSRMLIMLMTFSVLHLTTEERAEELALLFFKLISVNCVT